MHPTHDTMAGLMPSLKLLCHVEAQLAAPLQLGQTPCGGRVIIEVLSVRLWGERLNAQLKGRAAADWLTVSPDRKLGFMDARCTIETDDGALVFMQYNGRSHIAGDGGRRVLYVAPRFETSDARYLWLNRIQAVGKGFADASQRLTYGFYELC
jgi:hypothetical protein